MQKSRIISIISIILTSIFIFFLYFLTTKGISIPNYVIILLPFLFLLLYIIFTQKFIHKKNNSYLNPFVNTNLYKLPVTDVSKIPHVNCPNFSPEQDETIYFAAETFLKDNEGKIIITNKRVLILNLLERVIIPKTEILNAQTVSQTAIKITTQKEKNYVILNQNDIEYCLFFLNNNL